MNRILLTLGALSASGCGLGAYAPTLADFMRFCDLGKLGKWRIEQATMTAMQASAVADAVVNAELDDPSATEVAAQQPTESVAMAPARTAMASR